MKLPNEWLSFFVIYMGGGGNGGNYHYFLDFPQVSHREVHVGSAVAVQVRF